MQVEVPWEVMRQRKIFLATPMYGGNCNGGYTHAVAQLMSAAKEAGIAVQLFFMFNESLIQRARNYCVDKFLRSDCTHMLFIDADIVFDPRDVFTLLALQSDESPYDVLAVPYAKKCISWEKIVIAVNKGAADKNPNDLDNFVGDFVFNLPPGVKQFSIKEPTEVLETGTGFMMIRRKTFEDYAKNYPELAFKPDHVRTEEWAGDREIHAYFDCTIDPVTKRYLSEDYFFCQNVRKMGGKVWICPWLQLKHIGTFTFSGNIQAMASLGLTPTADMNQLTKR